MTTELPQPQAEEPEGYLSSATFVKSRPENNEYYIKQYEDWDWYPIILRTHEELESLIPGYNISQIKEKFGGLRYYFDYPEVITPKQNSYGLDTVEKIVARAREIVRYAEAWVDGFEAAKSPAADTEK